MVSVRKNSLAARGTVTISEAAPSTETALPLAGGMTICTVRGRMTRCSARKWSTFIVAVVLLRFLLISRTLVCMTLVTHVVLPRFSLSNVVMNVGTSAPALNAKNLGLNGTFSERAAHSVTMPVYRNNRMHIGALWNV